MMIRRSTDADVEMILSIHHVCFPEEAVDELTAALLSDPSARPLVSLVAMEEDTLIGHVLFTAAHLVPESKYRISLLAPLAVLPDYQGRGIGGELVKEGLIHLARSGVDLVFVLGHPSYYPRFGFTPAGKLGFSAPYPIEEKNADAWMVLALNGELPRSCAGMVKCAKALDRADAWGE